MTSPTEDRTITGVDGDSLKRKAPKRSADVDDGAFSRLQERTQTQLGFINNLLITLAIGLLAFEVNAAANSPGLDRGWREVVLLLGLLGLTLSVLAGLRLAFNRLASHRITTRVARLRQLRDRYGGQVDGIYILSGLRRQALSCEKWAWWTRSKEDQKKAVHTAAERLAKLIPETPKAKTDEPSSLTNAELPTTDRRVPLRAPSVADIVDAAGALIDALRRWYELADDWTWVWLRVQTWCFICGGVLLLVGPVIYYVFDHGAK